MPGTVFLNLDFRGGHKIPARGGRGFKVLNILEIGEKNKEIGTKTLREARFYCS